LSLKKIYYTYSDDLIAEEVLNDADNGGGGVSMFKQRKPFLVIKIIRLIYQVLIGD